MGTPLMFFPEGQVRVHLYGQPVGAHKSFDGPYALTPNASMQDPQSGNLFVFINRRATHIKVLYWDRTGFGVWTKRLEKGRFVSDWSKIGAREMDWTSLKSVFEGIVPKSVKQRYQQRENTG